MSTSQTGISWTDRTWNPVRGCSLVSPGCTNCYAMKLAHRFSGKGQPYEGLTRTTEHGPVWTGKIREVGDDALMAPSSWRKPARIFVNSMSDLFHESVSADFLLDVFDVMVHSPQHTFQILTKRPERMRDFMESMCLGTGNDPPNNIWLGVSVENQKTADERLPLLIQTPAATRFVSAEPLLELVNFFEWLGPFGPEGSLQAPAMLDWAIVGGESGPVYRDCDPGWIELVAWQFRRTGVPVWVKQDAGRRSGQQGRLSDEIWALKEFPS
jgi:protein gp37